MVLKEIIIKMNLLLMLLANGFSQAYILMSFMQMSSSFMDALICRFQSLTTEVSSQSGNQVLNWIKEDEDQHTQSGVRPQ
jgi:hypothetical protein